MILNYVFYYNYADDSILMATSRLDLQNSLDCVYDYCQRWKLYVNVMKTKILVFRKGGRLSLDDVWFYGDIILQLVESFSYLGVLLSSTGKFSCTQQDLADRGLRALFSLKRITYELIDPKPELLCMLDLYHLYCFIRVKYGDFILPLRWKKYTLNFVNGF